MVDTVDTQGFSPDIKGFYRINMVLIRVDTVDTFREREFEHKPANDLMD